MITYKLDYMTRLTSPLWLGSTILRIIILIVLLICVLATGCSKKKPTLACPQDTSAAEISADELTQSAPDKAKPLKAQSSSAPKHDSLEISSSPLTPGLAGAPASPPHQTNIRNLVDSTLPVEDSTHITRPSDSNTVVSPTETQNISKTDHDVVQAHPVATLQTASISRKIASPSAPLIEDVTTTLPALNDPCLADQLITINFDQVDIPAIIKTVSDITGINFIVDPSISGSVTVHSPTRIRLGDLYNYLESIIEVKGFAAIPAADHVKIVPRADVAKHNPPLRIGGDPDRIPQNDSFATQIIPIKYADAAEIGSILSSRMPSAAELSVYSPTNTILITGTSSNIHHLACIIQQLDVPGAQKEVSVIYLKYASAKILSTQITEIMEKDNSASRTRHNPQTPQLQSNLQIQPDERTNSLVITASRQDTDMIKELVLRLDIERPVGTDTVHVIYLKNAQAEEVAKALTPILAHLNTPSPNNSQLSQVLINPEPGTNSLIVNATAQDFEVLAGIIEKLDIVREQVLVELLIVDIREEDLQEIGIDWATLDQAVSDSVRYFASTDFGIRDALITGDLGGLAVGAYKEVAGNVQIGAILQALQKQSAVNILSTPHVVTSNHRKALILVGDNIPYVENSRITETDPSTPTVVKTFVYKDVGISLNITPHISQGGLIRLEIDSEFTQLIDSVTGASPDTPTTAKRQVQTEVSMADGATIVIGGLIRDDKITYVQKIPVVGDIPLLGELFKYKRDRLQKTNLLLFITPHIMSGPPEMADITHQKQRQIPRPIQDRLNGSNLKGTWRQDN